METITITEKTPFRLINRLGTNDDITSNNYILQEGEMCYITDTQRMYIGNGVENVLVNNKFHYINAISSYTNIDRLIYKPNDIVYIVNDSACYYVDESNNLIKLNITNNINFDSNIFTLDSRGLTIKPIEFNSVSYGKILGINVDNYGRIVKVRNSQTATDTLYFNFISNSNTISVTVSSNGSEIFNANVNGTSTIDFSLYDVWYTYNFSNTKLSSINAYEWCPVLPNYSSIQSLIQDKVGTFNNNLLTNIIIQPQLSALNNVDNFDIFTLNGEIVNSQLYATTNPLIVDNNFYNA